MDKEVLVDKIKLPAGVSRSTHFLAITKDLQVVAIKKDASMWEKAKKTRKAKSITAKSRMAKKVELEAQRKMKQQNKAKIAQLKQELKNVRVEAKASAEAKKKAIQAELAKAKKK